MEQFVAKHPSRTESTEKDGSNIAQAMVMSALDRTPAFIAEAVCSMRKKARSIDDAHTRYATVVAGLHDDAGLLRRSIAVKRAVFAILANK